MSPFGTGHEIPFLRGPIRHPYAYEILYRCESAIIRDPFPFGIRYNIRDLVRKDVDFDPYETGFSACKRIPAACTWRDRQPMW